jgi:long-chain acyl-CoA synthetase
VADGKGRIFNRAADVAMAWSRGLEGGRRPGVAVRAQHAVFDRLVYARLREALGGRCEYAVSGGAPLGDRLGHFYRGIGVNVLEGYGLTETTAALTVNLPEAQKVGTVGRPIQGTAVRVADDGELLFRGGQVFAGYWHNDAATAEAKDADGWFHTGDVGEIDDEGFVRITGRKKEILVTAGGKNVAPAVLEDRLRGHLLVDQCIVVGDGRPFIGALVTLDRETVPAWAAAHGKPQDVAKLVDDPDLRAEIEKAVEDANKAVSQAESIRKFAILPGEWTEEGGQLTPSLKLKRSVVMRENVDEVEELYSR